MKRAITLAITVVIALSACSLSKSKELPAEVKADVKSGAAEETSQIAQEKIDDNTAPLQGDDSGKLEDALSSEKAEEVFNPYENIPPDESGKVIIIMFHKFVKEYEDGVDKSMTTTFSEFQGLLDKLYDEGYRTARLSDFINGEIAVQRGCKPVIFTFDDGWSSQFNLIEDSSGKLIENPETAVGIMERFYEEHPDFGFNAAFFLNLGSSGTFGKTGTLKQRLEALAAKGLEIENHTLDHQNLSKLEEAKDIQEQIGKNAKEFSQLVPGKVMSILSLPYGSNAPEGLRGFLEKGSYEGFAYQNRGIMLVGAEPASQMYINDADPLRIRRVMASGIEPQECDLAWWLDKIESVPLFISDGSPNTITVPADKLEMVDEDKIKKLGKALVVLKEEAGGGS